MFNLWHNLKLASCEGLPELPPGWYGIVACDGTAIAGGDLEREALAVKVRVALPVLAPVPRHCLPGSARSLDRNSIYVTGTGHIGDQN